MENSYIVDVFLSACAWFAVIYLSFDCRARIKHLNEHMSAITLATALASLLKKSSLFSLPFAVVFMFLLWRFYGLMIASASWGAGGAGLLVIMAIIGILLIWLDVVLISVRHSSFMSVATISREAKAAKSVTRTANQYGAGGF